MRANYRVVLDACVLAPGNLGDFFLCLAEEPALYLPQWSEEILQEVKRTQVEKLAWSEDLANYWQKQVREFFPEAMVGDYEKLIPVCENDPKDRHILAAAIRGKSELIVTCNLKHFPKEALDPWDIEAEHPASYLLTLYSMEPGIVVSKIDAIARRRCKDPEEILARLGKTVPAFALEVASSIGWQLPDLQ